MADRRMRTFIEDVVDSLVKLQILMLFAERTIHKCSVRDMVQRTARDIWSISEALDDLVASGILSRQSLDHEPIYVYAPSAEHRELIDMILAAYNDPLSRDELHIFVRSLSNSSLSNSYRFDGDMLWGAA